tara:strand:+ start:3143 stop:3334 length:192 start_codon:yes stop_codon:yes gene_type:complete
MTKSYKREVALFLLAFWCALVVKVFFFVEEPQSLGDILGDITTLLIPSCLAVFGLDSWIKHKK